MIESFIAREFFLIKKAIYNYKTINFRIADLFVSFRYHFSFTLLIIMIFIKISSQEAFICFLFLYQNSCFISTLSPVF